MRQYEYFFLCILKSVNSIVFFCSFDYNIFINMQKLKDSRTIYRIINIHDVK
jgi:hypothetical protein